MRLPGPSAEELFDLVKAGPMALSIRSAGQSAVGKRAQTTGGRCHVRTHNLFGGMPSCSAAAALAAGRLPPRQAAMYHSQRKGAGARHAMTGGKLSLLPPPARKERFDDMDLRGPSHQRRGEAQPTPGDARQAPPRLERRQRAHLLWQHRRPRWALVSPCHSTSQPAVAGVVPYLALRNERRCRVKQQQPTVKNAASCTRPGRP